MTALLLTASVLGLLAGPSLLQLRVESTSWKSGLDGFALVAVGGISALHLLPESIVQGGLPAVAFGLMGALAPVFTERVANRLGTAVGTLILIVGLLPHAALESAALGAAAPEQALGVGAAVAAHRLPVGLVLFALARERFGAVAGWAAVGSLCVATLVGFEGGEAVAGGLSSAGYAWLQALVAGALLHVAASHSWSGGGGEEGHHHHHHHHGVPGWEGHDHGHGCDHDHGDDHGHGHGHGCDHGHGSDHDHHHGHAGHDDHHHHGSGETRWATAGAIVGAGLLALALGAGDHAHQVGSAPGMLETLAALALEAAPALLVAYVLAGLLSGAITAARARWLDRGGASAQALKGVAFGLPLPICSCGVLPVYKALIRRGVPATAAIAFLVATPELGLDAILLSIPLLGMSLTASRLVAAFLLAVVVALIVGRMVPAQPLPVVDHAAPKRPRSERLREGLRYGLVELVDHTMPWILAGLVIAAWAEPLLAHELLASVPPALQVPLFAVIGIPLYVCASGATPVAAIAIHKGIGAGAALAFLLAGPATNVTTFGVLSKLHGRKVAIVFGAAVTLAAVVAGLAVDQLPFKVLPDLHGHEHEGRLLNLISLAGLGLLLLASLLRQGPRGLVAQIVDSVETG